jgi:glycolate oxidase FAD binding subunit
MTLQPATIDQIQDAVRSVAALRVRGGGTKATQASPDDNGVATLDLSTLRGITEYSAEECVFTAWAGTPLREIEETLKAHGQYLPFDPPLVLAGATIGGTVAAGVSGSGRYRYGGVRDFLIGARVVDGEARVIRSGGKVVKNAAGFLLHHALVGSSGRLGVIAEVTFKVFPLPEARATVKVECGGVDAAFAVARSIEAGRFDCEALDFDSAGTLWVRVAGRAEALNARMEKLDNAIGGDQIADEEPIWAAAREFQWTEGATIVKSVDRTHGVAPARYFCAGACSWIAIGATGGGQMEGVGFSPADRQINGVIVRGPDAGARVGAVPHNEFEERVRRVLDPRNKFSAASHSGG